MIINLYLCVLIIINHPFRSCTDWIPIIGVSAPGRPFFETRRLLGPKLSSATFRFPSSASSAAANKATTCGEMFFLYVLFSKGNKNYWKVG